MNKNGKLLLRKKALAKSAAANADVVVLENSDAIEMTKSDNDDLKPWDQAHLAFQQDADISFAEPEVDATTDYLPLTTDVETTAIAQKGGVSEEEYKQFMDYWPHPDKPSIWHLDDKFSQLKAARDKVKAIPNKKIVRIAHFDTGYDPGHKSFPQALIRKDLERNFVEGEDPKSAADTFDSGILKMPGHGSGTLSILAGNKLSLPHCNFDDYFGLVDSVEIVPVRIAKGVVLLKSGAFVKAMDYVLNELHQQESTRIHIITMSMGGVASRAWADVVNEAYEKGIFIVTAAGNNFRKLPTRTLVYPARFKRVVAACGVTYDYSPYHKPKDQDSFEIMEGNYGPDALMHTAIAAFTPNVPWATYKYDEMVGIRGDGTSSATPQVAAAAALYYSKHYDKLEALPEPWMKVEAIRSALFNSARPHINGHDGNYFKFFGKGILQAEKMLAEEVPPAESLQKQDEDTVSFPFFRMILGTKDAMEDETEAAKREMLETELMQLLLSNPELQKQLNEEEKSIEDLTDEELKTFIDTVLLSNDASDTLKRNMLSVRRIL
jgi:subtilisin family serine protease